MYVDTPYTRFKSLMPKTSLPWAGTENAQHVQNFLQKVDFTLYFLQQILATCNNLIGCKTGLILG